MNDTVIFLYNRSYTVAEGTERPRELWSRTTNDKPNKVKIGKSTWLD